MVPLRAVKSLSVNLIHRLTMSSEAGYDGEEPVASFVVEKSYFYQSYLKMNFNTSNVIIQNNIRLMVRLSICCVMLCCVVLYMK